MKRHYSLAIVALLLLSACGPSKKDQIKQRLLDKCVGQASAGRKAPDAKLQGFLKDYCNCTVDKFADNLSEQELDSLDKMKDAGNSEIMQRLGPLVEDCATEVQDKMRAAGADR